MSSDPAALNAEDLPVLRAEIDRIDSELVRLLNQRAQVATRVGAWKLARGEAIFVPHREHQVFQRIASLTQGPLSDESLQAIWREGILGWLRTRVPVPTTMQQTVVCAPMLAQPSNLRAIGSRCDTPPAAHIQRQAVAQYSCRWQCGPSPYGHASCS